MQRFQNLGAVGNNQQAALAALPIISDSLRNSLYSIYVQTRVCFIQNNQFRMQHQHLQDFCLFLFPTGVTNVQIPFCIRRIHLEQFHFFFQFFLKAADKSTYCNARNFNRVLERQENTFFCTFVVWQIVDFFTLIENIAASNCIFWVSHQGRTQC